MISVALVRPACFSGSVTTRLWKRIGDRRPAPDGAVVALLMDLPPAYTATNVVPDGSGQKYCGR